MCTHDQMIHHYDTEIYRNIHHIHATNRVIYQEDECDETNFKIVLHNPRSYSAVHLQTT